MRFNETIYNQLEIDDEVIEEYIKECDKQNVEYTVDDFINFVNDKYYISDFVEFEDVEYNLESKFFLDEINRVKEQMDNE